MKLGTRLLFSTMFLAPLVLSSSVNAQSAGPPQGGAGANVPAGPGAALGPTMGPSGMGHGHHGLGMGHRPDMMDEGLGIGPHGLEVLGDELGLSPAQRASVRGIADETRKKNIRLRADLQVIEVDLRSELDKDTPDAAKVGSMVERIGVLETEMRKNHLNALLQVKKILTKEQRAKLADLRARGKFGGPPPGATQPPAQTPQPRPAKGATR